MKIAIIGGGGVRVPLLLGQLEQRSGLRGASVFLQDIDKRRLDLMSKIPPYLAPGVQVEQTLDPEKALEGANYVLLALRVGGEEARALDEEIPLRYGCLGQETTGAGGLAMSLRTGPVVLQYLDICRRVCPEAWILNLTNPSGIITQLLQHHGHRRVMGLCDAPYVLAEELAQMMRVHPGEVKWGYFGLNHLGWMESMAVGSRDLMPLVLEEIGQRGWGKRGVTLFPGGLISLLQAVPNEYCYFYYFSRKAVHSQSSTCTRGQQLHRMGQRLLDSLEDSPGPLNAYLDYLARRRGTYLRAETGTMEEYDHQEALRHSLHGGYAGVALDTIEALSGQGDRSLILNTANEGRLGFLKSSDVIEAPVWVGPAGTTPLDIRPASSSKQALVSLVKQYERLVVDSISDRCLETAHQALMVHPLVMGYDEATGIMRDYRRAHHTWLKGWNAPPWLPE